MTTRNFILSNARDDLQRAGVQSANATQVVLGNTNSGSTFIDGLATLGGLLPSRSNFDEIDRYASLTSINFATGHQISLIVARTNAALESAGLPELTESEILDFKQHTQNALAAHLNDEYTDNDFYYETVPFEISTNGGRSFEFLVDSPDTYNQALSALIDPDSGGRITIRYDAGDGYFLVHHYQRVDNGDGIRINVFERVEAADGSRVPEEVISSLIGSDRLWVFELDGDQVRALSAENSCFSAGTKIAMWPLGQDVQSDASGYFDQSHVKSSIWRKEIEKVEPNDWVVSFDQEGRLVPGRVVRTTKNNVEIILDFFGTSVTPGHVYYRADSSKSNKFETLIDILRADGALQKTDGTVIRASTGAQIGGPLDALISVVIGDTDTIGRTVVAGSTKLRAGHRVALDDGSEFTLAQIIEAGGGVILENGLVATEANPEGVPFHWVFGEELPKPEDYVLQRSGVTLEDIYRANEWQDMQPKLPAPLSVRGPAIDQIQ